MNKVITINLNGRAYQLEEAGYEALRKYLDEARAALRDDPDKDEIMADFEQAVADKCDACLGRSKNVVSVKEIEGIIAKMGPVDGGKSGKKSGTSEDGGAAGAAGAGKTGAAPKRLYRIMEGSVLKGVCGGIAAYFNIDATLVRMLFVLLTIFTGGGWIIVYIVLAIVMPIARTADEVARAHGEPPFTAKDFIDRARAEYEKYKEDPEGNKQEWKQHLREQRHEWRREWREKRRAWREWRKEERSERHADRSPCVGVGVDIARIIGGLITAVIVVIWVVVLIAFLTYGTVFGHPFGVGHPLWVSLLFLIAALYLITFPFRLLTHNSCHYGPYGHHYHGGLGFLVLLAVLIYTAVLLFPSVQASWSSVIAYLQSVR